MIAGRQIESDSEDSEEEEEGEVRIQTIGSQGRTKEGRRRRIANVFLLFAAVLLVLYMLNAKDGKQTHRPIQSSLVNPIKATKQVQKPPLANLIQDAQPEVIKRNATLAQPNKQTISHNATLVLPDLDQSKLIGEANFMWGQLQKGTMHWFTRRQVSCKPDIIINSATKIQQSLYLQKTAYTNITLLSRQITIPAENIYQFEAARQFIANLTKNAENTVAYCHSSALLLMLTTVQAKRGLYACTWTDQQLFESNIIVNDLFPLVKPYTAEKILSSNDYNILISDNFSLLKTLLFEQKKQLVLIMEIIIPTTVETYVLLKLKAYRFEQGNDCDSRKAEIYEESVWHIDNTAVLMPGWYAFTTESYPLPISYETKDYQSHLYSPRKLTCVNSKDFKSFSQRLNHDYVVTKVPYEGLHLLKTAADTQIDQQHYRQIVHYFQQNPVRSLYLHSGSYYLMTLLISTLAKNAQIAVASTFNDIPLLKKNLVLNNLQVNLLDAQLSMAQSELVITSTLKDVLQADPQRILLINEEGQAIESPHYLAKVFTQQQQCNKSSLISTMLLSKQQKVGKRYLLTRIT